MKLPPWHLKQTGILEKGIYTSITCEHKCKNAEQYISKCNLAKYENNL